MSIVERVFERETYQRELADLLRQLLDMDVIDDKAAKGITLQVIAKGEESLSRKQQYVFQREVNEPYCEPECDGCGTQIPFAEAWDIEAGDVATYCSGCKHTLDRAMRD